MNTIKGSTLKNLIISILFALNSSVFALDSVWSSSLGWTPLKSLKPQRAEGSKWFRDGLTEKTPIKVLGKRYQSKQYLASITNGELTYTPSLGPKITGFRAFIALKDGGTLGSVIFRVKADDKIVFTSELISHSKGNTQRIEVGFPPANSITLITDPNGSDHEDWSFWLEPQIKTGK